MSHSWCLSWFVLTTVVLVGCTARPSKPRIEAWSLTVESITAQLQRALLRCDPGGTACSAIADHEQVTSEALVRTESNAQALLTVPEHGKLWMDEQTELAFVSAGQPTLELRRGRVGAECVGTRALALRFLGYEARVDSMLPTRFALQFRDPDQAEVTVLKGKLLIRRSGEAPIALRSGASVFFSRSRKPVRTRAVAPIGLHGFIEDSQKQLVQRRSLRGFGQMTARIPGRTEVVLGVRLASHVVRTQIRDGIARTEIEEIFENETAQVLEGRYVFPVPPDASISRLALWVGSRLMEGEVLESSRAAKVFHSIVEDTVRPRDPALLEWASHSEVSLKVFPIPAHGTRKVLLAYDQVLTMDGNEASYVYPLSAGEGRAQPFDRFEVRVSIAENRADVYDVSTPGYATQIETGQSSTEVALTSADFSPERDFVLHYRRKLGSELDVAQSIAGVGASSQGAASSQRAGSKLDAETESFFLARLDVDAQGEVLDQTQTSLERVFLLDTSHSQSKESLQASTLITLGLLEQMDPNEQFAILACDSSCRAFPEQGLKPVNAETLHAVKVWLAGQSPKGSSDLSGALIAGVQRFSGRHAPERNAQLIYLGDGAPSAGELRVETIEQRTKQMFAAQTIDVRLLGIGSALDESTLSGLARRLGGVYQRVPMGTNLGLATAQLHLELRQPVVKHATLTATPDLAELCPRQLPNLVTGKNILALGKVITPSPGKLILSGEVNGAPYSRTFDLTFTTQAEHQNPYLGRLWAAARIAELEEQSQNLTSIVELSRQYRVMSRHTAWLVLESDAMFSEYGIGRSGATATSASASKGTLEMATQGFRSGAAGSIGEVSMGSGGLSGSAATGATAPVVGPKRRVRLGGVSFSGGEIANANRVVAGMRAGFRNCYSRELAQNPDAQGSMLLTIMVGEGGEVVRVVSNNTGNLGDAVACVLARARAAQFEPPNGGSATISTQITFEVDPAGSFFQSLAPHAAPTQPYVPYVAPKNSVTHRPGDEDWRREGVTELEKLQRVTDESPKSRNAWEALIRALIRRGRSVEAVSAARRFADLDPNLPRAFELLAYTAAVAANRELAVAAIDAQAEIAPHDSRAHHRAAEALAAAGDEVGACAHWRSLDELHPRNDQYATEALRCRFRIFGERDAVLVDARAIPNRGPLLDTFLNEIEAGHVAPHVPTATSVGQFKASIHCEAATCPTVLVITPNGTVFSPFTPGVNGATERSVTFSGLVSGTYRTLLIGGSPEAHGTVEVSALGTSRKFEFSRGGITQTIAATSVVVVNPEAIEDSKRRWWRSQLLPAVQ